MEAIALVDGKRMVRRLNNAMISGKGIGVSKERGPIGIEAVGGSALLTSSASRQSAYVAICASSRCHHLAIVQLVECMATEWPLPRVASHHDRRPF